MSQFMVPHLTVSRGNLRIEACEATASVQEASRRLVKPLVIDKR
jgi:hypothetical protein